MNQWPPACQADALPLSYGGIINLIPEIPNESILSKIGPASMELKRETNIQLCEKFSANSTTELCRKISIQGSRFGQSTTLTMIRDTLSSQLAQYRSEKKFIEEIAKGVFDVALSISRLLV